MNTTGIAAVDELDALLTRDDFEGDVDTALLDATEEALLQARAVVASLVALRRRLAAGCTDEALITGLSVDARIAIEALDSLTAGAIA